MNKYVPYLITGIVAGLIVKQMGNNGVNTTVPRPEEADASNWWKFW